MSLTRINEIKLDIDDLTSLLDRASRQKSKDILGLEIRRLQTELVNIQNQTSVDREQSKVTKPSNSLSKCYDIKLNNYAWDQTSDFIKLYVNLSDVQTLPKEAVFCNFLERSMDLHVQGLKNKNYELTINNLCENINATKSYVKIKTDFIVVFLAKTSSKSWSCITSVEKRLKESKTATPNINDTDDPNASLMNLMKKMYQDGDDDMKKTIAKAWTESQEKREMGAANLSDM
ncbi:PREDICTED: calcyclin-binding protein [Ceratosolen solmsi marchali]|uniref:Calcyclin-binding protein n=1 Tax=Ceratosolen solmsi marchali TaxID=326594 RepID=A0AAJ6YXG0_9HYME|nr:PREDICTED: calcyclin-binding protein [Ceratosolen solmsi marchali]